VSKKYMASDAAIDKQINTYLTQLTIRQKKAVLNVVKTFAEEREDDMWEDVSYINEMNTRFKELEGGKVKGYSLDEVEKRARQAYKAKKNK
jgi:hypothetical protein